MEFSNGYRGGLSPIIQLSARWLRLGVFPCYEYRAIIHDEDLLNKNVIDMQNVCAIRNPRILMYEPTVQYRNNKYEDK